MDFDFLDGYLLDETPPKAQVVKELLARRYDAPGAAAFYRGIEMLGAKTPDLTLIALRLVLSGKTADDERVVGLRELIGRARSNGPDREEAIAAYRKALQ